MRRRVARVRAAAAFGGAAFTAASVAARSMVAQPMAAPPIAAQPVAPVAPAPRAPDVADGSSTPCGASMRAPIRAPVRAPAPRTPRIAGRSATSTATAGAPRGYLGLRLSEISDVQWTDAGRLVHYCAYPLVVSVEPASPAERAGLGAGDTLLAYGTRDLVRDGPVALDRLLVPGQTVRIRLRRDGRTLTRPVVVGERPGAWAYEFRTFGPGREAAEGRTPRGWTGRAWHARVAPRTGEVIVVGGDDDAVRDSATPDRERRVRVFTRERVVPPPALGNAAATERAVLEALGREGFDQGLLGRDVLESARMRPAPWVTYLGALPPLPPAGWATHGPAALAGAQVVALDDDLREAVAGAPARGVFVLKVLPGTPAAEAGLRAGDVVLAAAGRPVHTPAALQRVLAGQALAGRAASSPSSPGRSSAGRSGGERRTVELRVARGGVRRDVVLRW